MPGLHQPPVGDPLGCWTLVAAGAWTLRIPTEFAGLKAFRHMDGTGRSTRHGASLALLLSPRLSHPWLRCRCPMSCWTVG